MQRLLHSKYRLLILLLFVLSLPAILSGSKNALENNSNNIQDWLPASFEETERLYWFGEHFGSDELLMISWEGCSLDDERLVEFSKKLIEPTIVDGIMVDPYFWRVFSSSEAMDDLTNDISIDNDYERSDGDIAERNGAGLGLSDREALSRLEGWLIGKDHRTACMVALIAIPENEIPDRHAAIEHVYQSADQIEGLSSESIFVAGTTIQSVAIDKASNDSLPLLTGVSFLTCFLIIWVCFRSYFAALMVFSTALLSQQLCMALVHYSGGKMDSVLLMAPLLVYVLGISSGVHLINYYRDAINDQGLRGAAASAINHAWTPCLLAAGTTAIGLVSLATSQIVPVRNFGIYSAGGVILGVLVLVVLLPCELEQFPLRRWTQRLLSQKKGGDDRKQWSAIIWLVSHGHLGIVLGACILLAVSGWGFSRIQTTVQLNDLFTPETKVLRDYEWLENKIGPLVPVEIILKIPPDKKDSDPKYRTPLLDRLQLVRKVHQTVLDVEGVDAVISATTFAPKLPQGRIQGNRIGARARRFVLERKLTKNRTHFVDGRFLADTPTAELWRISARVYAGHNIDYGRLLNQLKQQVEPVLTSDAANGIPNVEAVYCGGVPLVYKAQNQLLHDLIQSSLIAFGFIALAMIVLLRNILAGLLSMIPNVLPCLLILGIMGFLGLKVEIGSMLTATAAMGIAVDDTLHFITWFRRGLAQGKDRSEAVQFAYARCGKAMIQTTLICGLGLLVMQFSQFMPIVRFAWLMFFMLSAALLCDLIILPAILIGPLGRVFQPNSKAALAKSPPMAQPLAN